MPDVKNVEDLFEDRKEYKESTYPTENENGVKLPAPIDFWYEKTLYGRVDERQIPVYISAGEPKNSSRFKQIGHQGYVVALNFVVDAFLALKREFERRFAAGLLSTDSLITELDVKAAYIDVDMLYEDHLASKSEIFINSFLSAPKRNEQVKGFDDFLKQYVQFVEAYANLVPITKTAFINSQYCTPLISGLIVEIATDDHDEDEKKEEWLEDLNFSYYANSAKEHGFLVDKNAPWRLVADITSPKMKIFMNPVIPINYPVCAKKGEEYKKYPQIAKLRNSYAKVLHNYGTNSPRTLFARYYKKSYLSDIENLQQDLIRMYEQFFKVNRTVKLIKTKACPGYELERINNLVQEIIVREDPISIDDLKNTYSENYWNEFYFLIRLKEEKLSMHKNRFNKIVKNANVLLQAEKNNKVDKNRALWYINEAVRGFPEISEKILPELEDLVLILEPEVPLDPAPSDSTEDACNPPPEEFSKEATLTGESPTAGSFVTGGPAGGTGAGGVTGAGMGGGY